MWYCEDCGEEFDEPDEVEVDLEYEYGVGGLFPDHHYANCYCCPCCGSMDVEECEESEDEEEWEEENE